MVLDRVCYDVVGVVAYSLAVAVLGGISEEEAKKKKKKAQLE